MAIVGVVADDVTGANDIGLMYAKHGYRAEVYSDYQELDIKSIKADVIILDTNSRCDEPRLAYEKVFDATRRLLPLKCRLMIKKTCSVFRGNIGVEFDAMLDAAGADFAVAISAFPKNGRVTKDGIHYVRGQLLVESEFSRDPVHPMRKSDLREIVAEQSRRSIALLDYRTVAKGIIPIRREVEKNRKRGGYLIADAISQEDLQTLAEALAEEPFIFGSSAISEELPVHWGSPEVGFSLTELPRNDVGTLIIAGSVTPQTQSQVNYAEKAGVATAVLDTELLFTGESRRREIERLVKWAVSILTANRPALIYSDYRKITSTHQIAHRLGFSAVEAGRTVSRTLGEITLQVVETASVKRMIVAGGETSNDINSALGINGNLVIKEIQPGLPSGLSHGRHELLVVLKSGSFGSPDFLIKACKHLESL